MTELFKTAIHEAGHALMAQQAGLEVVRVIINEDTGHCHYRGQHNWIDNNRITLAGPVAERLFFGDEYDCLTEHGGAGDLNSLVNVEGFAEFLWLENNVMAWAEHYRSDIEELARQYISN